MFLALKVTVGLRVPEDEELAGLDVLEHGAPGYGADAPAMPSTVRADRTTAVPTGASS